MANWWDTPSDESAVAESAPTLLDTATLERQARQAQLAELLRPTPTSAEPSILSTLDSYRQAKAAAANPSPVTTPFSTTMRICSFEAARLRAWS